MSLVLILQMEFHRQLIQIRVLQKAERCDQTQKLGSEHLLTILLSCTSVLPGTLARRVGEISKNHAQILRIKAAPGTTLQRPGRELHHAEF